MDVSSYVVETVITREYVITLSEDEARRLEHLLQRSPSDVQLSDARIEAQLYDLGTRLTTVLENDGVDPISKEYEGMDGLREFANPHS